MKKIVTCLLVASLMTATITGCTSKVKKNSETNNGQVEKPKEITVIDANLGGWDAEAGKEYIKLYESKTGIKINYIQPEKSSWNDKVTAMIMSGQKADVVSLPKASLIKQGYFLPLDDYIKNSAFYSKFVSQYPDRIKTTEYNGHQYGLPRNDGSMPNFMCFWVRKDWMDKLNLKNPTNPTEFADLLRAFKNGDPDGNGKNDTLPFTRSHNTQSGEAISMYYGIAGIWETDQNGKYVDRFTTTENKEKVLDYWKMLVDEGLMDKEYVTNGPEQVRSKGFSGKTGCILMWGDIYARLQTETKKAVPTAVWGIIPPVMTSDGNGSFGIQASLPTGATAWVIPKTCTNPGGVIKYFTEYVVTDPDMIQQSIFGTKGIMYNVENGIYKPTDAGNKAGTLEVNYPGRLNQEWKAPFQFEGDLKAQFDIQTTYNDFLNKNNNLYVKATQHIGLSDDIANDVNKIEEQLHTKKQELTDKYVLGQITWDEVVKEFNKWSEDVGYQQILDKINKALGK